MTVRCATGSHGATTDKNGRDVATHGPHQHAGHDLVAIGNTDQAIEPVRLDHRLHAVGDELAAGQAILHADVPHGDPVIDTDSIEHEGYATCLAHGLTHDLAKIVKVNVAGDDVYVAVGDGDEGFTHIFIANTRGLEQAAVRCALKTFFDHIAAHNTSTCFTLNLHTNSRFSGMIKMVIDGFL